MQTLELLCPATLFLQRASFSSPVSFTTWFTTTWQSIGFPPILHFLPHSSGWLAPNISPSVKPLQPLFLHIVQNAGHALVHVSWQGLILFANSASYSARCSKYIYIVLLKWYLSFHIAVRFSLSVSVSLSNRSLYWLRRKSMKSCRASFSSWYNLWKLQICR